MRNQMLNAELTIVRPRVYVSFVDNLSAEVVHGVFEFVDEEQHGGTIVPRKAEQGRIVELASRRALPSPSPSANLVGITEGQLRRD